MNELAIFPLLRGELADLPQAGICPVCGEEKGAGLESITLAGGAMFPDGEGGMGPAEAARAFLNLYWNRDPVREGEGFLLVALPVVADVHGGQYSIRVCSSGCLRELFMRIVAELEARIEREVSEYG